MGVKGVEQRAFIKSLGYDAGKRLGYWIDQWIVSD
jgi:hypothetical protein